MKPRRQSNTKTLHPAASTQSNFTETVAIAALLSTVLRRHKFLNLFSAIKTNPISNI